MISGRFLTHLHVSGINHCYIYKQVSFSIAWISFYCRYSSCNKQNHAYCKGLCTRKKFPTIFFFLIIVRCILIFLFNKSKTLCGERLWQRCFTWWAGTAPKPAWLPLRWARQTLLGHGCQHEKILLFHMPYLAISGEEDYSILDYFLQAVYCQYSPAQFWTELSPEFSSLLQINP